MIPGSSEPLPAVFTPSLPRRGFVIVPLGEDEFVLMPPLRLNHDVLQAFLFGGEVDAFQQVLGPRRELTAKMRSRRAYPAVRLPHRVVHPLVSCIRST